MARAAGWVDGLRGVQVTINDVDLRRAMFHALRHEPWADDRAVRGMVDQSEQKRHEVDGERPGAVRALAAEHESDGRCPAALAGHDRRPVDGPAEGPGPEQPWRGGGAGPLLRLRCPDRAWREPFPDGLRVPQAGSGHRPLWHSQDASDTLVEVAPSDWMAELRGAFEVVGEGWEWLPEQPG